HQFLGDLPDVLSDVPTTWPVLGEAVGDFIVVRELGRGGFSRVYLGVETTTGGRPVALKFTCAGTREAKTLGPLSHPHLITVLSSPTIDSWKVVAMPFVGTATLDDVLVSAWALGCSNSSRSGQTILDAATSVVHLDDPPFTTRPAFPIDPGMRFEDGIAAIAASLFSGIAYLHAEDIAHRDLKPSNVLLGPTGHPYLLDFNLATTGTDPWRMAGTLPYMSPEQLVLLTNKEAIPPSDWRAADVFSCGVVLFELLSGEHPFADLRKHDAGTSQEKLAAVLLQSQTAGHRPLASLNPRVGRTLRAVIERCLSIDPAQRPTAESVAELLAPQSVRRTRWRRSLPILLAAGVLCLVLVPLLSHSPRREVESQEREPGPLREPSPLPVPTDPFERGLLLSQKGEYSLAASEFLAAGRERQDGRAFAFAAYCYSVCKNHSAGELAAGNAIRLKYGVAAVYANRAYNRLQINRDLQGAKIDCDMALNLEPNLRAARYTRADIHLRLALPDKIPPPEAIEDIEWVTTGSPNTADVWMTAAKLYALVCDDNATSRNKAINAVREAIRAGKDPTAITRNPVIHSRLHGHPNYEEALKLTPGNERTFDDVRLVNPIPNP
ncbi:MAG TPA: serine/threonine-protein kinase, partial [Gemmata sp.]|nr:serine/threonine-protein kinase [Gemmata sp.]